MLLKPEQNKELRKTYKRLILFLALVFLIDAFIAFLFFSYTKINTILCGFIIIVITAFFYLCFHLVCVKIDKRKAKKLAESGKKDPFSKN